MRKLTIVLLLAALGACSTNDPTQSANVQVSFATQTPGPALSAVALNDTLAENGDTLVVTRARVVLKEIELKRVEQAACDSNACEEFALGPVLVDLPLGPGAQQQFALNIPAGSYDALKFDVHKPDDGNPTDQAFVAANPDFFKTSIIVEGTFNGQAFTYKTDLDAQQEITLVPTLVVTDETSTTNLTILLDLRSWFRDQSGVLVNPADANDGGPYASVVANNIQHSIQAYEDKDRDGGNDH